MSDDEELVPLQLQIASPDEYDIPSAEKINGDWYFTSEISRALAERWHRAVSRANLSDGELWDAGREQFGEALQYDNAPSLYDECESGEEAQAEWVRNVLRKTTAAILDEGEAPPNSPVGKLSTNPYRVDEVLE